MPSGARSALTPGETQVISQERILFPTAVRCRGPARPDDPFLNEALSVTPSILEWLCRDILTLGEAEQKLCKSGCPKALLEFLLSRGGDLGSSRNLHEMEPEVSQFELSNPT